MEGAPLKKIYAVHRFNEEAGCLDSPVEALFTSKKLAHSYIRDRYKRLVVLLPQHKKNFVASFDDLSDIEFNKTIEEAPLLKGFAVRLIITSYPLNQKSLSVTQSKEESQ